MKSTLCFVAFALVTVQASCYPITPRPLRKLVMESEFIIVAYVRDLKSVERKDGGFTHDDFSAILEIREQLKGRIRDSVISVPYSPGMICPWPPQFEKNTEALVFLDKRKQKYYVHALSYGVKTLNQEAMNLYKARIREMKDILQMSDKDQQFEATTEWLVTCAEQPATRYEGIYELSPGSDFMSFYDQDGKQPFEYALSQDQKDRLKTALFATTKRSYDDLGLVDLVYASSPKEVYDLLVQGLREITREEIWTASFYMDRLAAYKSSSRMQELRDTFEKEMYPSTGKIDFEKLGRIVGEFVQCCEK